MATPPERHVIAVDNTARGRILAVLNASEEDRAAGRHGGMLHC